jgi:hypothetical protein
MPSSTGGSLGNEPEAITSAAPSVATSTSTPVEPPDPVFVQCPQGHYYNPAKGTPCPFCPDSPGPPDVVRCPNGHSYDRTANASCPHCPPALPLTPPPALPVRPRSRLLIPVALLMLAAVGAGIFVWSRLTSSNSSPPPSIVKEPNSGSSAKPPAPTPSANPTIVFFSAAPDVIAEGQSTTLRWSLQNTASASVDQGIGPVGNVDRTTVHPSKTTQYTLTATGNGLSDSRSVSVIVNPLPVPVPVPVPVASPPLIDTFSVEPGIVESGSPAVLVWSVRDATSISIDQGVGSVALRGRRELRPQSTQTITLIAVGPGGKETKSVSLKVVPPPPAKPVIESFSAEPNVIQSGQTATLIWSVRDATGVSIGPGVGLVPTRGQKTVQPISTVEYALRASGPGGTDSRNVSITVTPPPSPPINLQPTSGVLRCSDRPVESGGQVVFENLPEGILRFTWDRTSWRLLPRKHPGGQDLILVPLRPGTRSDCVVKWEIVK